MKILICLIFVLAFFTHAQTTYYISSSQGNDSYNGLSQETPKKTLAALQSLFTNAKPGDKFLLRRGDEWTTRAGVNTAYSGVVGLDLKYLDGTPDKYITVGAYGTGSKPKFDFNGTGACLQVGGCTYTIIEDIFFTSTDQTTTYVNSFDGTWLFYTNRPRWAAHAIGHLEGEGHHIIFRRCDVDGLREGYRIQDVHHDITWDNCDTRNTFGNNTDGNGIYANVSNLTIINSTWINNGKWTAHEHGLYLSDCKNLLIENNVFGDSFQGIAITNGQNITVRKNIVYNIEYSGLLFTNRNYGAYPNLLDNVVIERNLIYNCRNMGIHFKNDEGYGTTSNVTIKNNIVYDCKGWGAVFLEQGQSYPNWVIANNTLSNSTYSLWIANVRPSNWIVKNNILYGSNILLRVDRVEHFPLIDFDYNLYYKTSGAYTQIGGTDLTFAQFRSAYSSEEANAVLGDPLFVNSASDFRLQNNSTVVSPAINKGLNLSYVNDDYSGNSRPYGNITDIGAYEDYNNTPPVNPPPVSSSPSLNMKIFLEGPYNNGSMNAAISGILPLSQPYSAAPWNYGGNESVSNIPSDVVDWILIELRSSTSGSSTVAKRAAFLKTNGTVVDLDGSSQVKFDAISSGDYYVVVRHRNHIDIMSSSTIQLSDSPALYDFTTSESQAYGSGALVNLGNNVWGMYAGDGDNNGQINVIDYGSVGNYLFESGYKPGDIDMNGTISVIDYGKTNSNLFKVSQVPN